MLTSRRSIGLLDSTAQRTYASLVTEGLRLYVATSRELVYWVPPVPSGVDIRRRLNLAVILSGRLLVRREERSVELKAGEWMFEVPMGGERWEGDFSVLVVEWDTTLGGTRPFYRTDLGALTPVALAHLRTLASQVSQVSPGPQANVLASAIIDALGLDVFIPNVGFEAHEQELMQAVAGLVSQLETQPMWQDLQRVLKLSERQLRRRFQALMARTGGPHSVGHFRRYFASHRLAAAKGFLSMEGVKLERVARSCGYHSARALCTAFRQAGLPSPARFGQMLRTGDGEFHL